MSLVVMVMAIGVWAQKEVVAYRTGFESTDFTATTTYNKVVTQGPENKQWQTLGTVTTNDKHEGSQSLQMRVYANQETSPYAQTKFSIDNITKVVFYMRSENVAVCKTMSVLYSEDGGETWTNAKTITPTTSWTEYTVNISEQSEGMQIKFEVGYQYSSSTKKISIDDVQIYSLNPNYVAEPYTVTFNAGNGSCSTSSLTESSVNTGVILPTCTPPDGYTFEGWSLQEGGEVLSEQSGETYSPSSDCTLYAIYKKIPNELDVVYDFNDKNAYPKDFPTSSPGNIGLLETEIDGNILTINAKTSCYIINYGTDTSRGLFFGKTSAINGKPTDETSYLEFPAKSNCKLVKVQVTTTQGVAGSVKLNIYSSDWQSMSIECTTVGSTMNDFTFSLIGSQINTPYRLASGTSGKNLQFNNIVLTYEKVEPVTLPVSSVGYSTYYNSLSAYTMPEGCEGLTAKYADGTLALNSVYKAGDVVPAGEPLIIRAEKGNYTLNFVASNAKPSTDNDLLGTDESTALEADDTSYFYALSLNKGGDPNSVGFYWMNETGAAFTNGAHKAYLKLAKPAASKIKQFVFADDATAISAVSNAADDAEAIYSVSGARQNTMKKGINIVKVGGQVKKVYVK